MFCKISLIPSMHIYEYAKVYTEFLALQKHIVAILPELLQYCKNSCNTNLHANSIIAAIFSQCCGTITRYCYCNILAIYCQKAFISLRVVCLANRIRISEILLWDRKSYLTHAILPRLSREGYVYWLYLNLRIWSSDDVIVMLK